MGAVGKNLLSLENLLVPISPTALARCFGDKNENENPIQKLTLSSLRLLDLKPRDLSNKRPLDILLHFLTDETGKIGKPREYFERAMLSPENFNGLSEDEKSTYTDLVRKILNKAFIN